jgi:PAS domain S-box-containing protein
MEQIKSKILIVDDNTFYLSVLGAILKSVDAEIYVASSGKQALQYINENEFALAILDIEMPEMDGFELAGHIRALKYRDLVPIIFLTAYLSDDMQMFKGYHNGAIDYLTKPVNKDIFLFKVRIFLELDQQKRNLIESKNIIQKAKLELEQKQYEMKLQNEALRIAQNESEESRKKYIKLYDFAPTGYFTTNKKGEIFDINQKGANLLDQASAQLSGTDFKTYIEPGHLEVFEKFNAEVFDNIKHSGCELKLKLLSGKNTYVYLDGALMDDKKTCLISMSDITERKEAQLAQQESEELYHSLLKTSPDGIIITDMEGRITEASNIAAELLGDENLDIEGKYIGEFVPRSSFRSLLKIGQITRMEGMVQNYEIKLNRKDKSEFIGEISTSQIRGNQGELKAFMSVVRDISERKLIEKQLRHSERMAGIGELATGMAHEINQPLNTISLSNDNILLSLENGTLTEEYLKNKLNKVFDNITRIKKIIDHVRTFSRDQDDFIRSDFDINTSIQNSISMISEQLAQKEIQLEFIPDENLPVLTGNGYRFEQVIVNMIVNAKDAIEERKKKSCENFEKRITITTKANANQVVVEIKDSGTGIKNEDIDKVLLPFFTTKAPGHGTGLGLSISYGIIKELGGEIEIQSKLQKGTTVQIKIPVQETKFKNKYKTKGHVQ